MIPGLLQEEYQTYRKMRLGPLGGSRESLERRRQDSEKTLESTEKNIQQTQQSFASKTAELDDMNRQSGAEKKVVCRAQIQEEFKEIASLAGVQKIEVDKRNGGILIDVFVRIRYRDVIYDNEDWQIRLYPGQSMPYGHEGGVNAHILRRRRHSEWSDGEYPRFHWGQYKDKFCFGDAVKLITQAVKNCNYPAAARLAVAAMHFVQPSHITDIPKAFYEARDRVQTLAEQVVTGDKNAQEQYERMLEGYVKFRLTQLVEERGELQYELAKEVDKLSQKLKELQKCYDSQDAELTRINTQIANFECASRNCEAEFEALLNLPHLDWCEINQHGVKLKFDQAFAADSGWLDSDHGVDTLYLGPGYAGRPSLGHVIDKLCRDGDILAAAKLALKKLHAL